ncbi:MAG: 3-deoxy-manno-octulosonate cytidylyltransferase [Phenylobacterium sp.]|uniref:3-deoxy-manno-octulosonate cytidylyltransferase n=1 Tax=Phenylobacterium sp. TaxID=1871053 RepID=UPI0027356A25|nr:3-deoxy-manno-octulosonate cytidylyltransferase [Phenylobacterium sp.]MDP1641788.1 3-deoxy-manno-octulosonate cytidylyltransferase [Phenylobacterium sp.]MDP3115833.1 3-deoxy-manno-octulosonate cytidylyltransferase [Phenylobacterium sp.]
MTPIVLIPARMAATRLPGKPLADIEGVPMIVRVLRQAQAAGIGPVAVAAGDPEIVAAVEAAGGRAVLTDPDLPSGSDRILRALEVLDPQGRHDVVINLQGDIPFVAPQVVADCADLLAKEPGCDISTIVVADSDIAERSNPDIPKAVLAMAPDGRRGRALYFTRSTLYGDGPVWLHHGVYGYRREALVRFTSAQPSPLEQRERLEQLRALELGMTIWATVIDAAPISVDNPADLERARAHARAMSEGLR